MIHTGANQLAEIHNSIPVNVITGFLGVGKTTAVLALLAEKPAAERWAVLVNEFGEIGVDGAILKGTSSEKHAEVVIREIPGGCMCCAAGLPMRVALNSLISRIRPDRILIEPSGLGHPAEIIASINQPEYRDVLELQSVITLVDARKLSDERYAQHRIFNQQLEVADYVIANKQEQYAGDEFLNLRTHLTRLGVGDTPVFPASWAAIDALCLKPRLEPVTGTETGAANNLQDFVLRGHNSVLTEAAQETEALNSHGWVFGEELLFDFNCLYTCLSGLAVTRLKAVFKTDKGNFSFNMADEILASIPLQTVGDSRLEIIIDAPLDMGQLEREIKACATASPRGII